MISPADQRVGPAAAGVHAHTGKQTRVELHPRRKSPSAKAKTGIGELHRVLEKAVESDPGAGIRLQRSVAAIKENVMRRNLGADRQVNGVREKAEGPVANLERPHERGPIEMRQEIDGADVGVHLWLTRQRRQCRRVDTREPQVWRDKELVSAWGRRVLCRGRMQPRRSHGNACENREHQYSDWLHLLPPSREDRLRSGPPPNANLLAQ